MKLIVSLLGYYECMGERENPENWLLVLQQEKSNNIYVYRKPGTLKKTKAAKCESD